MTQPTQTIELPKQQIPFAYLVVTDHPETMQSAIWQIGKQHPFNPELVIVRMYVLHGTGVAVYAAASDGRFTRNIVPWSRLRVTQEAMDMPKFLSEIAEEEDAVLNGPAEEEDEEEEPTPPAAVEVQPFPGLVPMTPPTTPNGTPS